MASITLSSREFNQDTSRAKKASCKGPVIITDRGRPAHVLLSIEEYERLTAKKGPSLAEALGMPGGEDIEFDPPRLALPLRPMDFD